MKIVNVRIKYGGQVMAYECGDVKPALGDWVVAKNGDQTYLGQVVSAPVIWMHPGAPRSEPRRGNTPPQFSGGLSASAGSDLDSPPALNQDESGSAAADSNIPEAPVPSPKRKPAKDNQRSLLRLASPADLDRQAEHEVREKDAFEYCYLRVQAQKLEMKLVAVEVVFDGSKTIFYYTAEERVDFRQLVKELVSRFRTRIEMRQIGVRHEARMVGGLGICGRCFCCSGFLSNFAPVSVKMAKEQNVSLSPAKISGVCGRLMCCLAFEHFGPVDKSAFKDRDLDE